MAYKNIEDKRKQARKWYAENSEKEIIRVRKRTKEIAEWYAEVKSNLRCAVCGESHPACLEFHHTDPNLKDMNVSILGSTGYSKNRILEEMSKCVVLCSNCHKKEHYRLDNEDMDC